MGTILDSEGNALTQSQFLAKTEEVSQPSTYTIEEEIFEQRRIGNSKTIGTFLKFYSGQEVPKRVIDALFDEPTLTSIDPDETVLAGDTTHVLTGTFLEGTTEVTVEGGAAVTPDEKTATTVTFTAPARTAGTYDVTVTTPAGSATLTDGLTYAAE